MGGFVKKSDDGLPLPQIRLAALPTAADQVFEELQQRIRTLALPPLTRLSETEVAREMGVSRQPVREAFKRLSKLGFLVIRPQSSTTVSLISEEAVMRARFVRTALEVHTCRAACQNRSNSGLAIMAGLIDEQRAAVKANDRDLFHELDDQFHHEICNMAGAGYVWDLIQESKCHMDRMCMLSLNTSAQRIALNEHIDLHAAISDGDPELAAATLTNHLSRIVIMFKEIRAANQSWFTDRIS